jgi:hypothetical protein
MGAKKEGLPTLSGISAQKQIFQAGFPFNIKSDEPYSIIVLSLFFGL